ncbi:MAG: hypothetical protein SFY32_01630 [Bacteroidota bacterium]|nr:hypothetical protein [Bacteroidota bacterium]
MNTLKLELVDYILMQIQIKIENAKAELLLLSASMNEETKSSAGDKYETSREMIQQSIQMAENQINSAVSQIQIIKSISWNSNHVKPENGALIKTNTCYFLIGGFIGPFIYKGKEIYAIASNSPIFSTIQNKKVGDLFKFKNSDVQILEIC